MRSFSYVLTALLLVLATQAEAQQTCRASDITSDGIVATPDFIALGSCFGHTTSEIVPSGDDVGYAPALNRGIMGRDQECRDAFGSTAHWCTTGEISLIEDATALPELVLLVRATPPLIGAESNATQGVDPISGQIWRANSCVGSNGVSGPGAALGVERQGGSAFFRSCSTSGSLPSDGLACCIDPAPTL